ncbi:MAG: hypothetical protein IPK15_25770, partial [Verrucomicrobia bacterium]|nr:hypothetical protein [Verrucomicrobiota bacterium]
MKSASETLRARGRLFGWRAMLVALLGFAVSIQAAESTKRDAVVVDEKTETIIRGALKWLASKQLANGAWGSTGEEQRYVVAMTGYTLMAFQAAGQLPGEGEFGKNVTLGMQYLLDQISPEGLIGNRNGGQYMYTHGITAIALGELYGQTK